MSTMTTGFVPPDLDASDFANLEPLYRALLVRPLHSAGAVDQWLRDLSDLDAAVDEYGSRRYIDNTCHTDDAEIEKRFLHFVQQIEPRLKPLYFELQKKLLATPHRDQITVPGGRVMLRKWQADVELFRPENIPLQTRTTELTTRYGKINGAMTVRFRGQEYTLQQMARFLEEPDRDTRQQAWELSNARRLQDRETLSQLFEELLALRQQIATNAQMADYRAYAWKAWKRFDYTPEDCLHFADTVAEVCMPLVEELDRRRRQEMGVQTLRPWDLSVDVKNRPPLRPFEQTEINAFIEKTRQIFHRLAPQLAEQFALLQCGTHLDLESRKGKRPGGYQCSLEQSRQPFIFMNAAGLHRDVETMLHEAGHAFHYQDAVGAPEQLLTFVRSAPLEFCEVASMSMELLGDDYMEVFYNPADAARAKRMHLEGIIRLLPWIATIDSFQHWLYTNPGHPRKARTDAWLEVLGRFSSREVDWSGHEESRRTMWQRQGHLYNAPFYYIEYGIAQLGALQVWLNFRRDPEKALTDLRRAFALGGSRALPELFTAAGIRFDFSKQTLTPLVEAVGQELAKLPA